VADWKPGFFEPRSTTFVQADRLFLLLYLAESALASIRIAVASAWSSRSEAFLAYPTRPIALSEMLITSPTVLAAESALSLSPISEMSAARALRNEGH
jgi:hypothetical protein